MVALKGKGRGGPWQLAPALEQLWREANAIAPRRDRSSDGSIGDPAHAARTSNHNPQESGRIDWVDAIDIDHDPANGMDIHARVRQWVAAGDDRLEEVISNGRIWTWARRHEGWRKYSGANAHTLHAHITVRDSHRHSTRPWFVGVPAFPTPGPPPYRPPAAPAPPAAPQSEEDDMHLIVIRDKKGIAHILPSGRTVKISEEQLGRLRDFVRITGRLPIPEVTLRTDAEWTAYTGWA